MFQQNLQLTAIKTYIHDSKKTNWEHVHRCGPTASQSPWSRQNEHFLTNWQFLRNEHGEKECCVHTYVPVAPFRGHGRPTQAARITPTTMKTNVYRRAQ